MYLAGLRPPERSLLHVDTAQADPLVTCSEADLDASEPALVPALLTSGAGKASCRKASSYTAYAQTLVPLHELDEQRGNLIAQVPAMLVRNGRNGAPFAGRVMAAPSPASRIVLAQAASFPQRSRVYLAAGS